MAEVRVGLIGCSTIAALSCLQRPSRRAGVTAGPPARGTSRGDGPPRWLAHSPRARLAFGQVCECTHACPVRLAALPSRRTPRAHPPPGSCRAAGKSEAKERFREQAVASMGQGGLGWPGGRCFLHSNTVCKTRCLQCDLRRSKQVWGMGSKTFATDNGEGTGFQGQVFSVNAHLGFSSRGRLNQNKQCATLLVALYVGCLFIAA